MTPRKLALARLGGTLWLGQDAARAGAVGAFMPLILGGEWPDDAVECYALEEWAFGRVHINGIPTFGKVAFMDRRAFRRFRWWLTALVLLTGSWQERWDVVTGPWHRWRQRRAVRRYKRRMEKKFPGLNFDDDGRPQWEGAPEWNEEVLEGL